MPGETPPPGPRPDADPGPAVALPPPLARRRSPSTSSDVNVVLGSSILGTIASFDPDRTFGRGVARFFAEVNTWAIALTITFGIAPLLFLQVLHGRLFYSATVILAPAWLEPPPPPDGRLLPDLRGEVPPPRREGSGAPARPLGPPLPRRRGDPGRRPPPLGPAGPVGGSPRAALDRPRRSRLPPAPPPLRPRRDHAGRNPPRVGRCPPRSRRERPRRGVGPGDVRREDRPPRHGAPARRRALADDLGTPGSPPRPDARRRRDDGARSRSASSRASAFSSSSRASGTRSPTGARCARSLELFGLAMLLMLVTRHQLRDLYIAAAGRPRRSRDHRPVGRLRDLPRLPRRLRRPRGPRAREEREGPARSR